MSVLGLGIKYATGYVDIAKLPLLYTYYQINIKIEVIPMSSLWLQEKKKLPSSRLRHKVSRR